MTGVVTITALSTGNMVRAEDVKPAETLPVTETQESGRAVSQAEVDKAKSALDKASQVVADQEAVVKEAEAQKTSAEQALAEASSELERLENLAQEATPEGLATAEEAVQGAETELAASAEALAQASDLVDKAKANLTTQEEVVTEAKATLDQAKSEEAQAQKEVDTAQAILDGTDTTKAAKELAEAKTALDTADKAVLDAEQALVTAEEADKNRETALEEAKASQTQAKQEEATAKTVLDTANQEVSEAQLIEEALAIKVSDLTKTIDQLKANIATEPSQALRDLETSLAQLAKAQDSVRLAEQALAVAQADEKKRQEAIAQAEKQLATEKSRLQTAYTNLNQLTQAYTEAMPSSQVANLKYFNQADPRWSLRQYGLDNMGRTGCGPATLALIFSELTGRTILPTEIADYLYHQTTEFNKRFTGTSTVGLMKAAEAFGLVSSHLSSLDKVKEALMEGHFVGVAVQQNKFTPYGGTHFLALKGYSNGATYAYDPYTRSNIGWYPLASLWVEQSTDWIDTYNVGAPFVKYTTKQVAQLEKQLATARQELTSAKQVVTNREATLTSLTASVSQVATLTNRLTTAKAEELKATQSVATARQTLEKAKTDKEALAGKVTQAETTLTKLSEELSQAQASLSVAKTKQAEAQAVYDKAKASLMTANQSLRDLEAKDPQTPEAQAELAQAKEHQLEAQDRYRTAQTFLARLSDDTSTKQVALDKAKANLVSKTTVRELAQTNLTIETTKQDHFALTLEAVKETRKLTQALKAQAEENLSGTKTYLSDLKALPDLLEAAKVKKAETATKLREAKAYLDKEVALYQELEAQKADLSEQYSKLKVAFEAYLKAQELTKLAESYDKLVKEGQMPVPVVDERGKVTGYVAEKTSLITPTKAMPSQAVPYRNLLPETGETSSLWLMMAGTVLSFLGLVLKKERKEND